MRILKTISIITILFVLLFSNCGIVLGSHQENPLIKAIQLFDKGVFSEAEPILKKLLDESPDNLMLNYYYAACRTEMLYFGSKEINCLQVASNTEAPLKADYYLANQYHATEHWEKALKFYNRYKQKVDSNEQDLVKLNDKIQQCFNKENPFAEIANGINLSIPDTLIKTEDSFIDTTTEIASGSSPEPEINDSGYYQIIIPTEDKIEIKEIEEKDSPVYFRINSSILYTNSSQFKTDKGKALYKNAMKKQNELEENLQKTDNLRKAYNSSDNEGNKSSIGSTILSLEEETYLLKEEYDNLFYQAKSLENVYWENATEGEWEQFDGNNSLKDNASEVNRYTNGAETKGIDPNLLFVRSKTLAKTSEIKEDELVYKIQIGAFSRGLPNYIKKLFKKLSIIRKIENYTDEKGVVVYTTGNLTNLEDAVKMQKQVKQEGAEDAIVVPYFNGKRITLERVKEIVEGK